MPNVYILCAHLGRNRPECGADDRGTSQGQKEDRGPNHPASHRNIHTASQEYSSKWMIHYLLRISFHLFETLFQLLNCFISLKLKYCDYSNWSEKVAWKQSSN